jgi:hypothetical protein
LAHDWRQINLAGSWLALMPRARWRYGADLPWGEGVRMVIYDDPGTEETDLFLGLLVMCEKRAANIIQELNDPAKRGIYTHVSDTAFHQKSILEEAGYRIKKYIFNMHRAVWRPDRELPPGFSIRTAVAGPTAWHHALIQEVSIGASATAAV